MTAVHCVQCGRAKATDDQLVALAWVQERDGELVRWRCPGCARAHVRDIEGKLPDEYW
ncbi:hypothetical protein EV191_12126 [Tamaricihabitans halophyticus]|uniref:Small CPxCG-related zinc finger protein n=1 Tax=Tamaricihabitans halophyticus TaxID=1262583 RepID=A0A4R2Q565_9PSEU|nr:hypothetical protein [Tamaricihabitans halophyticus]TCP43629.1 hypothetical protein EV191_12126 [Tamaricihabitans halophyticus]